MASTEISPFRSIPLTRIWVGKRHRPADRLKVIELATSIRHEGLLHPIVVNRTNNKYKLVVGLHRFRAFEFLAKQDPQFLHIPCKVVAVNANEAELMEIDENLIRSELTELQRSVQLHRKKELYESLFPSTKVGGRRERGTVEAFTERTSRLLCESRRSIERYVQIGKALVSHAEKLASHSIADSKMELLALAGLRDRKIIKACVTLLTEGACKTVAEARKIVEMRNAESVNGYPSLPSFKSQLTTEQLNFPLLPSQKAIVLKALTKARREIRKDPLRVKDTQSNALAKICAYYLL